MDGSKSRVSFLSNKKNCIALSSKSLNSEENSVGFGLIIKERKNSLSGGDLIKKDQ